jgi:hypothetical protein
VVITTYCKDSSDTKFDGFDIRILIVLWTLGSALFHPSIS